MDDSQFEKFDRPYFEYRARHPDVSYSVCLAEQIFDSIKQGGAHASLGANLTQPGDWWKAGEWLFGQYCDRFPFQPLSRIVEYGCGSLRVGAHFIRYLDKGNYFGLDVISGFYEIGKTLIGNKLMAEKAPRFGVIGEEAVALSADFGPDFVFSAAVAFHVRPDEIDDYFANLRRIAHRPGATVWFDAKLMDQPTRIESTGWAWPLPTIEKWMAPLKLRTIHDHREYAVGENCTTGILEFRR